MARKKTNFIVSLCVLLAAGCCAAVAQAAGLPRVVILGSGGTIAGRHVAQASVGYTAAQVGVSQLIDELPQLAKIAQVTGRQVLQLPSQQMQPAHWLTLAQAVQAELDEPQTAAVVLTHGTDTLEETAYFLNLVVRSPKPVVLVGAMRPVTALSADGPFNLYEAVLVAAQQDARNKGVMVLLNDQVHAARDVTKANTSMTDAFVSPDLGALATVTADQVQFYRSPQRRHTCRSRVDLPKSAQLPQVDIVYGYAGASAALIDALVARKVDGIVYAGVGSGNFGGEVGRALDRARAKGVIVVRSSRVGSGNVARNAELSDDAHDFVVADNLNPQKARVLLMLGLIRSRNTAELQRLFFEH